MSLQTVTTKTIASNSAGAIPTLIATWFGCGFAPIAPGTVASAAALILAYAAHKAAGATSIHFAIAALLLVLPGIWAAERVAAAAGRKDPGLVVVDEVIGQWITLVGATLISWKSLTLAFVLFRILDVWKPAPARKLESLPGGPGIIADDVMAGIYGALVLFFAGWCNLY
jgi:phosphatidylglycerophosphatase A